MPRGDLIPKSTALILALLAWVGPARVHASGPDLDGFRDEVRPFLDQHCVKCHDPARAKAKGGVDLSAAGIGDAPAARQRRKLWRGVIEQVETLEMPPSGEPMVDPERRGRVVEWLKKAVASTDCGDPSTLDPGPPPVRRLTRDEYDRTLRDLLGLADEFRSAEVVGMPTDGDGSSTRFANLAEALILPPALMEKYFQAADKALERAFRDRRASEPLPTGTSRPDLARFLRRAYRRPVVEAESGRYLALFDRARAQGSTEEDANRRMLKAALVSPHFLFRIERDRPSTDAASYRVTDHELAVRLSYFLWSTMPDATLSDLADQGKLSEPSTFEAQVRRMLIDPRARALTDLFAESWLQVGKLANARPALESFPTLNDHLRRALRDETLTFFDELRQGDRSVLELLGADYAYLNQDLARHYDLPVVEGPALRRVALAAGSHRGGLLGMGSVLALTSHTNRTSPTLRGKYVLEVIFGTPPPPPPPDAGKLPEGEATPGEPPKSFREQMARHSRQAECAACHAKIDPLGYGLENYDAIGRWRVELGGRPIDASGKLPGGVSFDGADELKRILDARRGDFERNLIERMLSYALGRETRGDDECAVATISSGRWGGTGIGSRP